MRKIWMFGLILFFAGCPVSPNPQNDGKPEETKGHLDGKITADGGDKTDKKVTDNAPVDKGVQDQGGTDQTPTPDKGKEEPKTADAGTEPVAETKPEPLTEAKPEPVAETKPEPVAETKPESLAEATPEVSTPDIAGLTCQQRVDKSNAAVEGVRTQHLACSTNADCTSISPATLCRGACPQPVNNTGVSKVKNAITQVDQTYCKTFRADNCPYATPKCVNNKVFCDEQICVFLSCTERRTKAGDAINKIRQAHLSCSADSDCTLVFNGTQCAGACQVPINKTGEPLLKAAITQINQTICNNYQGDGCPYASPSCLPVNPKCDNNVCTAVRQ